MLSLSHARARCHECDCAASSERAPCKWTLCFITDFHFRLPGTVQSIRFRHLLILQVAILPAGWPLHPRSATFARLQDAETSKPHLPMGFRADLSAPRPPCPRILIQATSV